MSSETDAFLEHHGVKGMKWGVRRTGNVQKNLDRMNRMAKGKASEADLLRAVATNKASNPKDAKKRLERGAAMQKKVLEGKAFATSILLKASGVRIQDLNYHQEK